MVQFMASAVLGTSKDLCGEEIESVDVLLNIWLIFGQAHFKYLVATGVLAGVDTLALLCFADAVGGGSVGDGHRNLSLRARTHSVLAANHGVRLRRFW